MIGGGLAGASALIATPAAPPNGTITACVGKITGNLRKVDTASQCFPALENVTTWNMQGPAGAAGAAGLEVRRALKVRRVASVRQVHGIGIVERHGRRDFIS